MITVTNISKSFGDRAVIRDVSFDIPEGEVAVLLGPNGAGKTTTMRMMTGYYVPDTGDVRIGGVSVCEDPITAKRLIGYLPESNPLYRDMLVSEYLMFVARLMDVPKDKLRSSLDTVVTEAGIDEVFFRPISELSKGFRQRVGLAGALIGDPEVLILDEPTEGLDPNQRTDMRALLGRLAKKKTVLVSTHVLAEAQQMAHRVIVMNKGAIAGMGTIEELLRQSRGDAYTIEVAGERAQTLISELPSVVEVSSLASTHKGRTRLSVVTRDAEKMPHELSALIGKERLVIFRMEPDVAGLERVFRELTTGQVADVSSRESLR